MFPYGALASRLTDGNKGFVVNPIISDTTYYTITSAYNVAYQNLTYAYGEMWVPTGIARLCFSATFAPNTNAATFLRLLIDGVMIRTFGYQYMNAAGWNVVGTFHHVVYGLDINRKHTFQVQAANSGAGQTVLIYHGYVFPLSFWGVPSEAGVF